MEVAAKVKPLSPTHHEFLVLLEVFVDKNASGGIRQRVLHKVNALVPAWRQRGGSRGYLVISDGDGAFFPSLPVIWVHSLIFVLTTVFLSL